MPSFLCRDRYSDDDDQDKLHRRSAPCARPAAGHANFEPRARRAPAGGGNGVRRMTAASSFTLAELLICACADVWAEEGEVLATGIGIIPRIAQRLAKLTHRPQLMTTDGEASLVEEIGREAGGA